MKGQKHGISKDVLVCFGIAALLSFVFRLWIIVFSALFAMVIVAVFKVFRKPKKQESEPDTSTAGAKNAETPNDSDSVYKTVLRQITERVRSEYPEAKWIWAEPNACRRTASGEEVSILLNQSGGYRRAKIKLIDGQVSEVEFLTCTSETVQRDSADTSCSNHEPVGEAPLENYELLAYEWAEAHIMELNGRCNEAIGQGVAELSLAACELPIPESWPNVCEELKRAGLNDAECVQGGIKIKFLQQ